MGPKKTKRSEAQRAQFARLNAARRPKIDAPIESHLDQMAFDKIKAEINEEQSVEQMNLEMIKIEAVDDEVVDPSTSAWKVLPISYENLVNEDKDAAKRQKIDAPIDLHVEQTAFDLIKVEINEEQVALDRIEVDDEVIDPLASASEVLPESYKYLINEEKVLQNQNASLKSDMTLLENKINCSNIEYDQRFAELSTLESKMQKLTAELKVLQRRKQNLLNAAVTDRGDFVNYTRNASKSVVIVKPIDSIQRSA